MSKKATINTICVGADEVDRAARVLRRGGIAAFPTDTVYGVGAHAFLPQAVLKLYAAKDRPSDKAIPLLIPDVHALAEVAVAVPRVAYVLAERFWPGALTLVLQRARRVPDAVTAGGETVAVRAPDHPLTQALLAALGAPLAASSANLSGQPPPTTAQGVLDQLAGRIDLLLDGGACPGGVPSTVLDLTVDPPRVLREGGVPAADIERAVKA